MEQCPQLIAKWQASTITRPNPTHNENPNPNMNVQMIVDEPQYPNVAIVTRGGAMIGADQDK